MFLNKKLLAFEFTLTYTQEKQNHKTNTIWKKQKQRSYRTKYSKSCSQGTQEYTREEYS